MGGLSVALPPRVSLERYPTGLERVTGDAEWDL
jgi:hypothetical protein